ncbi:Zn-ribbon domain-containing OB-fold protein [Actinomadura xylanilytica]|uniref:Zn-ribbon domain-containing OB-fold protein n=1 Tax=Actinomadura xylanilytica TaxID=887459 RepID=UPI00255AA3E8|nr:OB-fold domain-containing protein [Actinomadura xylanilytica]MDL4771507.1 OB-fold domain-containing protein [Actinomadura xylanilytica]
MSLAQRPRPEPDRDSAPWWEAVRRHELTVQRCDGCGTLRFPARTVCNRCRSRAYAWVPARGTGRVYSWVVNHQVFMRSMADEVPFPVLLVRLDDGAEQGDDLLMYGNLTGGDVAGLRPGLPVEAVFVDFDEETTLVQWRPAG